MKLQDLDATFLVIVNERVFQHTERLSEAQGVMFLCPKCFDANKGAIGTHRVVCWFANRNVPDDLNPKPGRWQPGGTGLDDLTFVGPAAASVGLMGGCRWHGFVRDGRAA